MGPILMTDAQAGRLASLARRRAPNEACALLVGRPGPEAAVVERVEEVRNSDGSPETRFSVEAGELIAHYRGAEAEGMGIVGIFHSHPSSGAAPSRTDEAHMGANPVAWVIYSVRDGEMRAWTTDGRGGSSEVRIGRA